MGSINLDAQDNLLYATYNPLTPSDGFDAGAVGLIVREIKGSAGKFYGYNIHNNATAAISWVLVYFLPRSQVVVGTTVPDYTIKLPANGTEREFFEYPILAIGGLSIASTTTEDGATGAASDTSITILYK